MNLEAASDRLNPIVVKELRQGLRSRSFTVAFSLLLAGCVLVAVGAWSQPSSGGREGRSTFEAFFACLAFVGFLVVPGQAFRSLSQELASEDWAALTLTTLRPRQILWGKIASHLVQGTLYASATAPFLLFSYFLQGIGLASVLAVLVLAVAWQALLVTFAAAAATFAVGRFARGAAGAVTIGGLVFAFSTAISFATRLADAPADVFGRDGLVAMGLCALFLLTFAVIVFEVAAGRLAPSSANVAVGPRLALLVHLGLFVGLVYLPAGTGSEAPFALFTWGTLLSYLGGAYGMGEPDAPPKAIREKRVLFGLLVPGARRAFRFALVLEVLLALATSLAVDPTVHPEGLAVFVAGPALVALYLSLGALLSRGLPRMFGQPLAARAVSFAVVGLGTALPMLVALMSGGRVDDPSLNVLNPVLAFAEGVDGGAAADGVLGSQQLVRVCVGLGFALAADRLLTVRERAANG